MPQARRSSSGSGSSGSSSGGQSKRSTGSRSTGSRSAGTRRTTRSSSASASGGGTSARSTRARSSRSSGGAPRSGGASRSSGSSRSGGASRAGAGAAASAAASDPRVEAVAARIRKLNERIIEASKDAGETTLSSYEKALKAIAGSIERGPGRSDIEWVSALATTQAKFIRDVTNAWTSAARGMLK
jgi:hypothetical protein